MYAERRQRLLERMGPGAVAFVQGARLVTRSADTEFPFRQDSDFHYLTGFDHPHAVAVLRSDGGPPYTLFVAVDGVSLMPLVSLDDALTDCTP